MKVNTGDIVWVNLNPVQGGEKGKKRPCLVLVGSGHPWEIVIIVPITEPNKGALRSAKMFVPISATTETLLDKDSIVDCFQVRCVSENRLSEWDNKPMVKGKAPESVIQDVRTRLAAILDIGEEHVT